ncbi:GAF domain-containing protein [Variovorax sp. J22P271]|uniref:GAF domain-containing protein n=1 Tax=Variovorax davisae TaxID=3053515 RepID=UPI002577B84C|nr:GAF domain-containing protein [Variovorax sp. J22P271]MDM0036704.1 GAF domain-containing protein [Variovorax sp. J22P271]
MNPYERTLDHFSALLAGQGPQEALRYLNQGVPHRYTAVYRFERELLRNVLLEDKRGQMRPEYLIAVPFKQSFCQFVLRDQAFRTDDSAHDDRLVGHPYRGVVVSYHSVPVVDEHGTLWGTMSHFDMSSHPLSDSEFALLQDAAGALTRYLPCLAD